MKRGGVSFTAQGDKFRFRCYQLGTDEVFSCRPGMRRAYLGTIELLVTGRKLARTLAGRIVGSKEGFATRQDAAEALLEDFHPSKKVV